MAKHRMKKLTAARRAFTRKHKRKSEGKVDLSKLRAIKRDLIKLSNRLFGRGDGAKLTFLRPRDNSYYGAVRTGDSEWSQVLDEGSDGKSMDALSRMLKRHGAWWDLSDGKITLEKD